MLLQVLFLVYFTALFLSVCLLGINYYRIRDSYKVHPEIIVFLTPFTLNFLIANTIFDDLPALITTLGPCLIMFIVGKKLKNVRIIGLTGGIACGKSTLVDLMESNLNIDLIDCDKITRDMLKKDNKGYKIVLQMLGQSKEQFINLYTKQIEREKFSNYVFTHAQFRRKYTPRIGKWIMYEIVKKIIWNILEKKNLILIDAPILFQTKILQYICYPIIVVGCSEQTQIKRLKQRNRFSDEEAISRIRSQMPLQLKKKKATIFLSNEGTKEQLVHACLTKLNRVLDKNRTLRSIAQRL